MARFTLNQLAQFLSSSMGVQRYDEVLPDNWSYVAEVDPGDQ
jgi:hypothetical protein